MKYGIVLITLLGLSLVPLDAAIEDDRFKGGSFDGYDKAVISDETFPPLSTVIMVM